MRKTAVIGSRSIKHISDKTFDALKLQHVVSGGAVGVDTLAVDYAKRNKIAFTEHLPDYVIHGGKAPLKRNFLIIDDSDEVVAFWDGISTGTMHAVSYARKQGKPVRIYTLSLDKSKWVRVD